MKRLAVLLSTIMLGGSILVAAAQADPSEYGFDSVSASLANGSAGDHQDFVTSFNLKTDGGGEPFAATRDVEVELPRGLVGNPRGIPKCSIIQFATALAITEGAGEGGCPQDSQVGEAVVNVKGFGFEREPIYYMEEPGGDVVARLAFWAVLYPTFIDVRVRSGGDYGLTATLHGTSGRAGLLSARTVLWGVPADPSHDEFRMTPVETIFCSTGSESTPGSACLAPGGKRGSGLVPTPFLSNPTSCEGPLSVGFATDSYSEPGVFKTATAPLGEISGCDEVGFDPSFTATPTSRVAGGPTGLDTDLTIPQTRSVNVLSISAMRRAVVTLPEGMTINSSAADGLEACSAAQVGYEVEPAQAADCPQAAKLGSVTVVSPALDEPLQGSLYQRTPTPGHLFQLWLVADGQGVHVKLPGDIEADPAGGRLTAVFTDTPELPVEEIQLHIKGGARAPLKNPDSCGTYETHYELAPWSGGAATVGDTPMTIDEGCDTGGFDPRLSAGTTNPVAGSYSPFVVDVTREDGEQNIARLDIDLPEGESAKLAGVPLCKGAAAQSGACPTGSEIGSVDVAAGAGTLPLWIPQAGKEPTAVYLSGPYRGAPYSAVIKVPAQAGPFDLGTVVTRAAIHVDPETAAVSVASDPLPQFLEGVPITYRMVHVDIDRPNFTLNPTSCEPMAVTGAAASISGRTASLSDRFQVGDCGALDFEPKLKIQLTGATKRLGHPALKAVVTAEPGEAGIARAQVNLPHGEFLDQGNLNKTCTKPVLMAGNCPAGSVYGHAKAWTPLLEKPLEGNVYLVGGYGYKLPALVAELNGQIRILLVGKVDSGKDEGIRSTFEAVPDAPVSRFVLEMKGGKKYGLLENSENLCTASKADRRAIARFTGQNGKVDNYGSVVANQCGG